MKSRIVQALLAASMMAAGCGPTPDEELAQQSPEVGEVAQLLRVERAVPGQYIVVLRDQDLSVQQQGVASVAQEMAGLHAGSVLYTYESALRGFAVRMTEAQAQRLLKDARVKYIEEDGVVEAVATQANATWGLDRVDQRDLPLNSGYTYGTTASNVHAYIIDTGVLLAHNEFTGRMGNGFDAVTSGGNANDCNGHGTHVAGTVAGTTYGLAKGATVHPVRVLSCSGSGSNSGVIAGVDWVAQNHVKPAVANMSLGGGASTALDDAINRAISAGVTMVVAAGNDNANACNYSPARVPNAITVGSTTNTDARSNFSNYGSCVDIFAPGSNITSAWYTSTTATSTISGTSMAAPHVAGAVALYLANNTSATPSSVTTAIINNSTANKVTSAGSGSPNRLLYSIFGGGTTPGDTTAPTTSISSPSGGATLSGTVTISASASDNVGVTKVEFYAGSTLIGSDTSSPYSISWNTTNVADGSYSLTSKAFDSAGNVGTSSAVSVTVSNTSTSCSTSEQLLGNAGFESGNVTWSATTGVINSGTSGSAPRTGSWKAWLNGYGSSTTDTLYQQISIPSTACTASFTFWVKIASDENTSSVAYDKLTVTVRNSSGSVLATLATYSNLDESTGYVQKSLDLAAYKGQTVRVHFEGREDSSLATSFFIDDTALNITR